MNVLLLQLEGRMTIVMSYVVVWLDDDHISWVCWVTSSWVDYFLFDVMSLGSRKKTERWRTCSSHHIVTSHATISGVIQLILLHFDEHGFISVPHIHVISGIPLLHKWFSLLRGNFLFITFEYKFDTGEPLFYYNIKSDVASLRLMLSRAFDWGCGW